MNAYEISVKQIVGEASGIVGLSSVVPGATRIDWKTSKDGVKVDWQAVAEAVAEGVNGQAVLRDAIAEFTTVRPGNRPIRPYFAKESK